MNDHNFQVHGKVSAFYDESDCILYIELAGPFNLEFLRHYAIEVGKVRATITAKKWGSIVNVYGHALGPMDAIEPAAQAARTSMDAGLTVTAVVFHEQQALELQKKFWSKVYSKCQLTHKFCNSEPEAKTWLLDQLNAADLNSSSRQN